MTNAVHNPQNLPVEDLPTIYGFNNGGAKDWLDAVLLAQDGTFLGSHICSHEYFMPGDLGILEETRLDRHEHFQLHYPNGYKMEFVSRDDTSTHVGLQEAFRLNSLIMPKEKQE